MRNVATLISAVTPSQELLHIGRASSNRSVTLAPFRDEAMDLSGCQSCRLYSATEMFFKVSARIVVAPSDDKWGYRPGMIRLTPAPRRSC